MSDELGDIVQEFLVESHENLDQLDRDLVALEAAPGSRELLSSIFRTIHTIKGTSGFLAFNRLEKVTHVGESLLSRLRDGAQGMTPSTTDALLRMVDTVRGLLSEIEEHGRELEGDDSGVIAAVNACITDGSAPTTPAPAPQVAAAADVPGSAPAAAVSGDVVEPVTAAPAAEVLVVQPVTVVSIPPTTEAPQAPAAPPAAAPPAAAPPPAAPAAAEAPAAPTPPAAPAAPAAAPTSVAKPAAPGGPGGGEVAADETVSKRSVADQSIRVDVDLLDKLMNLVGELVLTRNQLIRAIGSVADPAMTRTGQRLNLITSELQESVMKTRMQAIDHLWSKLPRVVRDLSSTFGKQIRLAQEGKETELDRSLLEAVKDPLT
ncbi:Hpt domain-containing protein, partial [Dactylosporangium sp. NPDC049742]|uniref:Hpt domain-containing protein n=1 Tax=Dactylosporangium sp. NPDC049742 TaxID=3154737 RepID=UPI0034468458